MIDNWTKSTLGEISNINMGQSPSSSTYNDEGIGLYLIQGNADIKNRKTVPRQWTSIPTKTCNIGDILMTVRAPVGAIAKSYHEACIGRGVCSINSETINNEYLYQFLLSYEPKWKALEQGSTFTAVNGTDIKGVRLLVPPLPEQQKIAEILSTVDAKIEVINQQITETQELKKGLMQRLLTKGIGHTEFKDSPLGEIPKSWEVNVLGNIGEFKNGINKGKEDFGHGLPMVNLSDVFGVSYIKNKDLGLVNSTPSERIDYALKQGDVLFIRSSVKPSGVGLTAVVKEDLKDTVYSGFIIRFRDDNVLNVDYKKYCFYDTGFRNRLLAKSSVSANTNINQKSLNSLPLIIPPIAEQIKIADILSSVDDKIDVLSIKKSNYQELKKGLMQQLLTGKVRVNGLINNTVNA